MRDFAFAQQSSSRLPKHYRLAVAAGAAVHLLVLAFLAYPRSEPTRVSSAGAPSQSIATYVAGSAGGPALARTEPVRPKKPAPMMAKAVKAVPQNPEPQDAQPQDAQSGSGTAGVGTAGQGQAAPVRIGSGGNLTLLKRVQPLYPPLMQTARIAGEVVLDAVIHADGTIGEIRVLKATNGAFAQSAIAAVKQWRYSPLGFEGLLTVSVNFTLPR